MFDLVQEKELGPKLAPRTMAYIITHGENSDDDRLSKRGTNQILELARSRMIPSICRVYSADYQPCVFTAECIAEEYSTVVQVEKNLNGNPILNHIINEEEAELAGQIWRDYDASVKETPSLNEIQKAIADCTNDIASKHYGDAIAIVVDPLVSTIFEFLVIGGGPSVDNWLSTGYGSCGTFEHGKRGWNLVMPPDDSYLTEPMRVEERIKNEYIRLIRKKQKKK